ncbi:MAG: 50S ribosomal protein L7ae [Candidatus Diapherotrites archaeon]|nr:50S ribosomal protein L7ae [Candidatus Diapherotrites archaeon]
MKVSNMPKFEAPKELIDRTYEALEIASNTGKLKKGINETTKAIEREKAQLVVIANDVTPPEIVMHLPILCDEKNIAYIFVPTKKELGEAAGINVPTSAIAISEVGDAKDLVEGIQKKVTELKK